MKEPEAVTRAREFNKIDRSDRGLDDLQHNGFIKTIQEAQSIIRGFLALRELEAKEPVITLEISNEGMGDFWLESFNGGPLPQDEQFEGTYRRIRGEE